MGLGGCYSCVKYLMFAFNFLFWLLGCAILGVGIWVRVDPNFKTYVEGSEDFAHLYTGAYMLIAVGVVIMIIGFLGCCGAIRESQCMLAIFFFCLFVIFLALLGAGIWAIIKKKDLKTSVEKTLYKAIEDYEDKPSAKELMINVQNHFHCCGVKEGVGDYGNKHHDCTSDLGVGCAPKLEEFFKENMIIIAGVAIGIGVVMILGMIFSMMLCCAIRDIV